MKFTYKLLTLFLLIFIQNKALSQIIPQTEREALIALYNATNGDNWTNKTGWEVNNPDWLVTYNPSTIYGITIQSGHVVKIRPLKNNLNGPLPTEIGNFPLLNDLAIINNNLEGPIPESIVNLRELTNLSLYNNKLNGNIPANIGQLNKLNWLDFYANNLVGEIPKSIGNLVNLTFLRFYQNNLTGSIPTEIGQLNLLTNLDLTYNKLTGSIPKEIGQLGNLTVLFLGGNNLIGNIPNELKNLTKLTRFSVAYNQLSGKVPDFTGLPLTNFAFNYNKFRFIDFINEFPTYKANVTTQFFYNSQAKTDSPKTMLRHAGQTVTMEMFEDLRYHSGDTYQWYKNGVAIVGQTNRILTLSNVTTASAGKYMCRAYHTSNPDMSLLILEREPITLTVDTASYTCTSYSDYAPSYTITGTDGQPYRCGTIKVTPQLQNTDKIAEIKWTITNASNQTTFLSNQISPNIEVTQFGTYHIDALITNKDGCELYIGNPLEVIDCAICDATIPGDIVLTEYNTYTCGRRSFNLSFSNPNSVNLRYEWKFYKADGSLWYTENLATPNSFFDDLGTNRVELTIKNNQYECQSRTLSINIPVIECKNTCPILGEIQISDCGFGEKSTSQCDYTCGDRPTYFHFNSEQEIYENSTYSWTFKNPQGQVIGTSTSRNHQVPFTFTTIGNNKVELTITNTDGCPTVFTPLVVPVVSCCTPVVGEIKVYNNAHLRTAKPVIKQIN